MSWMRIERTAGYDRRLRADVEIGVSVRRSGLAQLRVSLRKSATPGWKGDTTVSAFAGEGDNAGQLLLRPTSGGFSVFAHRKSKDRLSLTLPLPPGIPAEPRKSKFACDMHCDGNDVVLTLPEWARPREAAPAPASRPAPAPAPLTQRGGGEERHLSVARRPAARPIGGGAAREEVRAA